MPSIPIGAAIRVSGTKETITAAGNIRRVPQRALREAALARAADTESRLKSEMDSEYRSAWATGEISRSVRLKVKNTSDGISAQLLASDGARGHLAYITALAPGGFNTFPVAPFHMVPKNYKYLTIRMPGHARNFIRNPDTGKLAGAKSSKIRAKSVMWGSKSGGFHRDVIAEVIQSEGELFVRDVTTAFAASMQSITMHPKQARSFLQDPTTGRMLGSRKS